MRLSHERSEMREPRDDKPSDAGNGDRKKKGKKQGRRRHREAKPKATDGEETAGAAAAPPSRLVTRSYSEAVLIARETGVIERSYLSECTYAAQQRFKELIQCERRMMPSRFSSTIILWSQSSRRRFKDTVLFLPRLQAKSYSETIYTFAKDTCHVFTSTLTQYTSREKSRWYTSAIELQPNEDSSAPASDTTTPHTSQDETDSQ